IGYTGATTVSNGMLVVNGSKSGGAGLTVAVNGGLAGTGSIADDVNATGLLLPGDPVNSPNGTLSISGNLTLNTNTNAFALLPGGASSQVAGINTLTVNGTCYLRPLVQQFQPVNVGDV